MRPVVFGLVSSLLLANCSHWQNLAAKIESKRAKNEPAQPEPVKFSGPAGEVSFVSADEGFAHIRPMHGLTLPAGVEVECRRDGRVSATLRVAPERKGASVAADILSGLPQRGDEVYPVRGKPGPQLVPVTSDTASSSMPAGTAPLPHGTVEVDPSTIRPEDMPETNLTAPPRPDGVPAASAPADILPEKAPDEQPP